MVFKIYIIYLYRNDKKVFENSGNLFMKFAKNYHFLLSVPKLSVTYKWMLHYVFFGVMN